MTQRLGSLYGLCRTFITRPVRDIAFSPDGTHLASSDINDTIAVQSVRGDDTRSIPMLTAGLLTWQSNPILLAGSGPGDVYRIDLRETSRTPKQLAAPEETNILGGALSPTGNLLILASAAQEADLLDPATGRVLGRFATLDATRSGPRNSFAAAAWTAAFTPDGDDAVFGTAEGHLQVITVDLPALAARACALAPTAPVSSSVLTGANLRAAQDACLMNGALANAQASPRRQSATCRVRSASHPELDALLAADTWLIACVTATAQAPDWLLRQADADALIPALIADHANAQAGAVFRAQASAAAAVVAWRRGDAPRALDLLRQAARHWSTVEQLPDGPPQSRHAHWPHSTTTSAQNAPCTTSAPGPRSRTSPGSPRPLRKPEPTTPRRTC